MKMCRTMKAPFVHLDPIKSLSTLCCLLHDNALLSCLKFTASLKMSELTCRACNYHSTKLKGYSDISVSTCGHDITET